MTSKWIIKFPWTRESEITMLELVKRQRHLWDPKDSMYNKTFLRRTTYADIAQKLVSQFPELTELEGDNVRLKFKNLKTYFLKEVKRIQKTPSGSEIQPNAKWELFDYLSFMQDTLEETPSQSIWMFPSREESSPVPEETASVKAEASEVETWLQDQADPLSCSEGSTQQPLVPAVSVDSPSSPLHRMSPIPSLRDPSTSSDSCTYPQSNRIPQQASSSRPSSVKVTRQNGKKRKRDTEDQQMGKAIDNLLTLTSSVKQIKMDIASSLGTLVETAVREFTPSEQIHVASKVMELISKLHKTKDL